MWGKIDGGIRRFGQNFRDMRLVKKMIFLYILIVFVPMILLGIFYFGSFLKNMQEQYELQKQDRVGEGKKAIENNLSQVVFCTRSFQSNTGLLSYVEWEDFSTAEGAYDFVRTVKQTFEQMNSTYPDYSRIYIIRRFPKEMNDPFYVQNGWVENGLQELSFVSAKEIKLEFYEEESGESMCRMYMGLYNRQHYQIIGMVCVECPFEVLFHPLDFIGERDRLFFTLNDQVWSVKRKDGRLCLEERAEEEWTGDGRAVEAEIEQINMGLTYYSTMRVLNNGSFYSVLLGIVLILAFFTIMYYMIYFSITKRITDLTAHMERTLEDRMLPYRDDTSKDEIGTMIQVYNKMANYMNQLIEEIYEQERLVSQARYYAMQSQIRPHFFYNTLENIDMLIEVGEYEKASQMIALFGRITRYNVSKNRERATVGEELSHIEDYLKLYSYRMGDNFSYEVCTETDSSQIACPYCMLQPVIENCFKHGFHQEERPLWVAVRVYRQDGYVCIEVEDNGSGIEEERLRQIKEKLKKGSRDTVKETGEGTAASVGLLNVHERIQLLCGRGSGLSIV